MHRLHIYCSDKMHTSYPNRIKNFQSAKILAGFTCPHIDIIKFSENNIYICEMYVLWLEYIEMLRITHFDMDFILLPSNVNDNVKSWI